MYFLCVVSLENPGPYKQQGGCRKGRCQARKAEHWGWHSLFSCWAMESQGGAREGPRPPGSCGESLPEWQLFRTSAPGRAALLRTRRSWVFWFLSQMGKLRLRMCLDPAGRPWQSWPLAGVQPPFLLSARSSLCARAGSHRAGSHPFSSVL